MTQNEAIKMAIKANLIMFDYDHPSLGAFATLVAEHEREACANTASLALLGADKALSDRVLKAIRARGTT
jgi:hypothetical protein